MTTHRRLWALYLAVLALALVSRSVAAVWWQARLPAEQKFVFGDSYSYWVLAGHIARGEPYQFGPDTQIFRTPGYPAALAVVFRLWGGEEPPVLAARLWGGLWGVAAVAATMWLARTVASPAVALLAGAIVAVHPETVASSVFVLSEATFCLPMLWQLGAWAAAENARAAGQSRAAIGWSFAAGIAAGVATLMRPGWLLFVPWALVVLAALNRRRESQWRPRVVIVAALLAGLVVTMGPWWWRNYQVTGRFVATTLQVGASLYDGLNPAADGGSNMRFVPDFIAAQRADDAAQDQTALADTFEQRLDRRLHAAAVDWAVAHPARVARLAVVKLFRLWNVWPNSDELGGWLLRLVTVGAYTPLVVLAGVGYWLGRPRYPGLVWCLLPAGYLTSLHVVFVSSIRYRQPAIFAFAILAAVAIESWRGRTPA